MASNNSNTLLWVLGLGAAYFLYKKAQNPNFLFPQQAVVPIRTIPPAGGYITVTAPHPQNIDPHGVGQTVSLPIDIN